MIAELSQYSVFFEEVDHELEMVLQKWGVAHGITENVINQHLSALLLTEINEVNDEESIKQLMDILLNKMLDDLTSK